MKNYINNFLNLSFKKHISLVVSIAIVMLPIDVQALPSGQKVVAGTAKFTKILQKLNITTSNKAIINYNSFNIGKNEVVRFIQPSKSSVVLNRVINANNPSSILGSLNANGRVFLVNPAGMYFGANSQVNANSFLATTLDISNENFLKDNYQFDQIKNLPSSYIIQKGSISVSPEGFVVLASPFVSSEGTILAKAGRVSIGATDNFYIQFDSNGLVKYDYKKTGDDTDTPIAIPKEYAGEIINNVINTDALNDAVKLEKVNGKIILTGAKGSALVSSKIDTSSIDGKKAGKIEVKAKNNAFILDKANLVSNADKQGDGGYISVFSKNLTYSDKGASYMAKGGSISGNGGFAEVSAKKKVIFKGSKINLSAQNGDIGNFLIDPFSLDITSNVSYINSDFTALADDTITLHYGISVSTNGGDITFAAPHISLENSSVLDAGSGNIYLNATSTQNNIITAAQSSIIIKQATLNGNSINITSTATSTNNYYDPDGTSAPIDRILTFLANSPVSPAGVSITNADASIDIQNGASITGNSINIQSTATAEGNVKTIFAGVAVGYGEATANAATKIESGASITANGGNIDIKSHATTSNKVKAYTVNLGGSRGVTANVTLSYAKSTTTSKSEVQNGATISANNGDVNIEATSDKTIQSSALAGAYEDGTLGAAVSIAESTTSTDAIAGGIINANNLNVKATTNNNLVKSSASAAVGSGIVAGAVVKVANVTLNQLGKYTNKIPSAQSGSNTTPFAISAAFAYGDHSTNTNAYIADGAKATTSNQLNIEAITAYPIDATNGAKGIKSSAVATVDSNDNNKKDKSVAGALLYTNINNQTDAYIGKNAIVESMGDIYLHSKTYLPYEILWHQINGVSDITDKLNSNIGIQNGFFTTWAQSNSQGSTVGAAGSVNIFHMTNDTSSYIDENAKINQTTQNFANISLLSETDLQSLNLSGVFGLKGIGAGGGKGGVGGSYLDILYDDTTTSTINTGATTKSKTLSLKADSKTKNISITEAGALSGKYGVAGSASYLKTNNKTHTAINGATVILDDPTNSVNHDILRLDSSDDTTIYNISGSIAKATNAAVGISVSINNILRDTYAQITDAAINSNEPAGSSSLDAHNSGLIGAYSLAGAVNSPTTFTKPTGNSGDATDGGGKYGIGISGDASINNITDNTKTYIKNSIFTTNSNNLNLRAINSSEIDSLTGSATLSASKKSVGIAGSYSQNSIQNSTLSYIDNSTVSTNKLLVKSSNDNTIKTISISGSGSPASLGIAGSVSINNISSNAKAYIINSSDITAGFDASLIADDSSTIKALAGAAALGSKSGIGASFAKNDISDIISSYISTSDLSSQGKIDINSNFNAAIDLLSVSVGAALSGMAAGISISLNNISNTISSYVNSKKTSDGIYAKNSMEIGSDDTSDISIISGGISGASAASIGTSILYNIIKSSITAYLDNTKITGDSNIKIYATSKKSIEATSVGGAGAGSASIAGSVVINTIKGSTVSGINGSTVDTVGTVSLKAADESVITDYGGTASGSAVAGIGGTVTVNDIQNHITSYIDNSTVNALGNNLLSVLTGNEDGTNENIRGVDIVAYEKNSIKAIEGTIGIGGSGALAATVSTNIIKNIINAYINNSQINTSSANANILQSARVRSYGYTDVDNLIGGASFGIDAGIGATVDTTIIKNTALSYIQGNSNVKANNLVQTKSHSHERINSTIGSGSAGGFAAFAGTVETVVVDNTNKAYIKNSSASSNKDLEIAAGDTTTYGKQKDGTVKKIIVGGLQASGGGSLGGSVFVNSAKHSVEAYAENSNLNAKGSTKITSDSTFDTHTLLANIGFGSVTLAASVLVNDFQVYSKAYTAGLTNINRDGSFESSVQDVSIKASSNILADSKVGAVSGSLTGIGGSVNVANIKDTVTAKLGSSSKANAKRNFLIDASSSKNVTDKVVAFSGGYNGVAGSVSITNINKALNQDETDAYDKTKNQSNTAVSKNNVNGRVGNSAYANEADSDVQNNTPSNVNSAFSTSQPNSSTFAFIDNGATVNTAGTTTIKAKDTITYNSLSGSLGVGLGVGVGGAVGLGQIGSNTRAFIGNNVQMTTNNLDIFSDFTTSDTYIKSYAGALGSVGLGAAVSKLGIKNYKTLSYIGSQSTITSTGDINIKSSNKPSAYTKAFGASAGAAAVGVVISKTSVNSYSGSYIDHNSHISTVGNINILSIFNPQSRIKSESDAAAGGIVSGSGSVSTAIVTPTVYTALYDNIVLNASGDLTITSITNGSVSSDAEGINISGISVGVSDAKSYWTPDTSTNIGNYTQLYADHTYINAYENHDENGNAITSNIIESTSFSATGSLIGGSGSSSLADSNAKVKVNFGSSNILNSQNNINISSKAYSKTISSSNGHNYGVAAGGSTHATSNSNADVSVDLGNNNAIKSQNANINISAYSRIDSSSTTVGGAGGLISGAGTLSESDIVNNVKILVKDGTKVYAKKGDIYANAVGYIDAASDTGISTGGIETINENKANINIRQNINVILNPSSELEANNIYLNAKVDYLHATMDSRSKTIAADSTSKAYANLDVTSNVNVDVKPGAKLRGYDSVNINALQNGIYLDTYAKAEIKAGITGTTYAKVTNNANINSNVNVQSGSQIYTRNLNIKSNSPDKSENIYKLNAEAKSNTIVQWVLTTVDKLVKKVSKIPIIGWLVKWVWKKVKEWVKHILHSDASSDIAGEYTSKGDITLNGDVYQLSSSPQKLTVAQDGTISTIGSITANVGANDITVNDLVNQDIGKITLDASGKLNGSANIYLSNSYPSVDITNNSDKNLLVNKINTISDNAGEPNIEIFTNDGEDFSNFNIVAKTLSHSVDIKNLSNSNIIFKGDINNYGGDMSVFNQGGNILSAGNPVIKTQTLSLQSPRGYIGTFDNKIFVELQQSSNTNFPLMTSASLGKTYLGIRMSTLSNTEPLPSDVLYSSLLNNITANDDINLALYQGYAYWNSTNTVTDANGNTHDEVIAHTSNVGSNYDLYNIISKGNIYITGENGVSLVNYAAINSGNKDIAISINDMTDPTLNEHIQSIGANDIYLNPIAPTGGFVNIALANGTFIQKTSGSFTVLDGYMHLNIQNDTSKNLHTDSLRMGVRTNGSFTINGVEQTFTPTGYNNGKINIASLQGGNINLSDAITPVELTGELSLLSNGNVFVNALNDLTLSQIVANDAWLQTAGSIIDLTRNNPAVTADNLQLNALNNIGDAQHPLTINANLLNAQSQNGDIYISSNNNIYIDLIQTPKRLTLFSNGGIYQNGDDSLDIIANELLLKSRNGVGDNSIVKNALDTSVNVIDIYNSTANDIAITNDKTLQANDLDGDGYALYNGGGSIDIKTKGDFVQSPVSSIFANKDLFIDAQNNIYISKISSGRDTVLRSRESNIYGNKSTKPNITAGRNIILLALNGFVGTPEKPIYVASSTTDLSVKAKKSDNFISTYIYGIHSKQNRHSDDDLSIFNNRPVSGTLIDIYNSMLRQIFDAESLHRKNVLFIGSNAFNPKSKDTYVINQ